MTCFSSDVLWEERKKRKRYKALNLKQCFNIEKAYSQFVQDGNLGKQPQPRVKLEQGLEVSENAASRDYRHVLNSCSC